MTYAAGGGAETVGIERRGGLAIKRLRPEAFVSDDYHAAVAAFSRSHPRCNPALYDPEARALVSLWIDGRQADAREAAAIAAELAPLGVYDVTPDNVLVTAQGATVVVDFRLAWPPAS